MKERPTLKKIDDLHKYMIMHEYTVDVDRGHIHFFITDRLVQLLEHAHHIDVNNTCPGLYDDMEFLFRGEKMRGACEICRRLMSCSSGGDRQVCPCRYYGCEKALVYAQERIDQWNEETGV